MKKIIKKIILILIIIGFIVLDLYLIDNFDYNVSKYGIIDKYGNTVIDFKYFHLNYDDLANNEKYISASTKSLFGDEFQDFYIDLDGNEYKDEMPVFSDNRAAVYSQSIGKEGYIDSEWNKISEFIYDYTYDYNDGFAKVIINDKMRFT